MGDSNSSDIETMPCPWTPIRKERSVYVQTDVITSDAKSDNEGTVKENCGIDSNGENKCDDFHCRSVSGEKINENIDICGNMNNNDIVKRDGASEISMDDSVTKEKINLSSIEENVSNCLK